LFALLQGGFNFSEGVQLALSKKVTKKYKKYKSTAEGKTK